MTIHSRNGVVLRCWSRSHFTQDVPLMIESDVGEAQPEVLRPWRNSLAARAGQLRAQTILTGQNGDLVTGNWFDDSLQVSASLRHLRLTQECKEALEWSKILRRPIYDVLARAVCAALPSSLAPTGVYAMGDGSYVTKDTETSLSLVSWIDSAFRNLAASSPILGCARFRIRAGLLDPLTTVRRES
jgi:hypothetical protein